ncbi:MAG: HAMP domain-containing histidine kinase, partial [Candidatus Omnitrophica bacterium]|nr:HAMP domain-containing histidine kinase [Candidatus Omnitrophota bacterium]
AALSYLLAVAIVRPVTELMRATSKISEGEMGHRVAIDSHIKELNVLAASFNEMAASLHERDTRVNVSNEKLATLNKRYLDLIGFVAHELKGILASTILNAYAVRDGFLGMINFKQRKALDSVARHLDYLEATVKNFLDLSRIEKGEMAVNKKEVLLKEDVFDMAQEAFSKPASEKHMEISSALSPALKVMGDTDLLRIVANNLLGNAVKYGIEKGKIAVTGRSAGDRVEVEVYNDGRPLTAEETERLFQRFSRVQAKEQRKTQGTGLGLFITKEIVEKHRGAIRVEPRQSGNAFIFTLEKGGQDGVTA